MAVVTVGEIIRLYRDERLAAELVVGKAGISRGAVYRTVEREGIPRRRYGRVSVNDGLSGDKTAAVGLQGWHDPEEAAARFGLSLYAIACILREQGAVPRPDEDQFRPAAAAEVREPAHAP